MNLLELARLTLLQKNVLFGSLSMRLPIKVDNKCNTAYTDGKVIGFSQKFVDSITSEQRVGLLAHEVLHCMFLHFCRRGTRDNRIWNYATDYVINGILLAQGFQLPPKGLTHPTYASMSSEAVYDLLEQKKEEQKKKDEQQQGGQDEGEKGDDSQKGSAKGSDKDSDEGEEGEGSSSGSDSSDDTEGEGSSSSGSEEDHSDEDTWGEVRDGAADEAEAAALEDEWKVATQQALSQFPKIGKSLGDSITDILKGDRRCALRWEDILADFLVANAKDDYNWMRPSRRSSDGWITPSLHNPAIKNFVVAIDTSGSVDDRQLQAFVAEINYILSTNSISLTVIHVDTQVRAVEEFTSYDVPICIQAKGRGGTSLGCVFRHIEQEGIECEGLVFFTDMENCDWGTEPEYPVLWLQSRANIYGYKPPFGEVVPMGDKY
jgi:predicted metal-dependent peptidase